MMNKALYIYIIIGMLTCVCSIQLSAKHIIGGELYYEALDEGKYRFFLTIYRDCNSDGNPFDSSLDSNSIIGTVTLYRSDNYEVPYDNIVLSKPEVDTLFDGKSVICDVNALGLCIERGVYTFDLNIPVAEYTYTISYQRCCRNGTIVNIPDPLSVGATYTVDLTPHAQEQGISSLHFAQIPNSYYCQGQELSIDHSAIRGHSNPNTEIKYSFCSPFLGGGLDGQGSSGGSITSPTGIAPDPDLPPPYTTATFVGGDFTENTPLGGSPAISIDDRTGLISGTPTSTGHYLYGVCATEYDGDGNILSKIHRDFELNVFDCENSVDARAGLHDFNPLNARALIDSVGQFFQTCGPFIVLEDISSPQMEVQSREWFFDLGDGEVLRSDEDRISLSLPGSGEFEGIMVVNPDKSCADTAEIRIKVVPFVHAFMGVDMDSCDLGPVMLSANDSNPEDVEIQEVRWLIGDSTIFNIDTLAINLKPGSNSIERRLLYADFCEASFNREIRYYPIPSNVELTTDVAESCVPARVMFSNMFLENEELYSFLWDFGDGIQSIDYKPIHFYENHGSFDFSLQIENEFGCVKEFYGPSPIEVYPSPKADFSYSPPSPSTHQNPVMLLDESMGAKDYLWVVDSEIFSHESNPSITFEDEGEYLIELIASNSFNCRDTVSQIIKVSDEITFFLPNAFRPESGSTNGIYRGQGNFTGMKNFQMNIYNRWGGLVFSSNDPTKGWNGKKNNVGEVLLPGVYVCQVHFTDANGKEHSIRSFATLIK